MVPKTPTMEHGTWNMKQILNILNFRMLILQSAKAVKFLLLLLLNFIQPSYGQEFKLFQPVPPQKSGITFKNVITENVEANALTHENLYNGGGVATGDLNGDGLDDIFFISNMGLNKLYQNLGDMKFKEITKSSGV
jgi:enediyne biosynthesis protein E4